MSFLIKITRYTTLLSGITGLIIMIVVLENALSDSYSDSLQDMMSLWALLFGCMSCITYTITTWHARPSELSELKRSIKLTEAKIKQKELEKKLSELD